MFKQIANKSQRKSVKERGKRYDTYDFTRRNEQQIRPD